MKEFRYILEPYKGMSSRHNCPECHKQKVFAFYIDTMTGELLPPEYGRCNRESKCSYHLSPYLNGYADNVKEHEQSQFKANYSHLKQITTMKPKPAIKPISFIGIEAFKSSLQDYEVNNFIIYLNSLFGKGVSNELISKYFIGSSDHWNGSTIFWQIDYNGKIRTGKIMLYDSQNGKRIKVPYNHIHWIHNALKQPQFELKQCFFGEHLLKGNSKIIAIVESEKTAIISSVYFSEFIWIAAGNLNGLNIEKCEALKGRTVILYPDLKAFDKWGAKAKDMKEQGINVKVSELLERNANENEKANGYDLADFLTKQKYQQQKEEPEMNPILKECALLLIRTIKSKGNLHQANLGVEKSLKAANIPIDEIIEAIKILHYN